MQQNGYFRHIPIFIKLNYFLITSSKLRQIKCLIFHLYAPIFFRGFESIIFIMCKNRTFAMHSEKLRKFTQAFAFLQKFRERNSLTK